MSAHNKYNDLKIARFPEKIESFRQGLITPPLYVRVKPFNGCNHGCHWCVYKADRREDVDHHDVVSRPAPIHSGMHTDMQEADQIPREKMLQVIDDFESMGVRAVTFSGGGESLMHPNIIEFMERVLFCGIDLSIITNGQLLAGARAEKLAWARWVRVSMDYTTPEQMARSRRVPERMFDQVLTNLQTFARLKRPTCDLAVNYIVHRENCHGLVDFARRLKDLGVENVRFSPMWCPDLVGYHAPIKDLVEAQLRDMRDLVEGSTTAGGSRPGVSGTAAAGFSVNSTYDIHCSAHSPERAYTKCFFMQTVPVVGADQKVYACHNKAYDATGCIGSIEQQSFRELWFSAAAKTFFENLNPQCTCRHQCANDSKNRHIHNLVNGSEDNFI